MKEFMIIVDADSGKAGCQGIDKLSETQCRNLFLGVMAIKSELGKKMKERFPHWSKQVKRTFPKKKKG